MNKVIITKCIDCACWCPANTYGNGVYCDELQTTISELDCDIDIPDYCPKLASQCINAQDVDCRDSLRDIEYNVERGDGHNLKTT